MDPRHPELALSRLKELIKQYDEIEYRISHATTSAGISQAEREGGLVVQEMCLVAPRIHEAMMQASRNRRHDLTHGVVVDMSKYEIPAELLKEPTPEAVENYIEQAKEEYANSHKKKATRKKKTTKKKKAE